MPDIPAVSDLSSLFQVSTEISALVVDDHTSTLSASESALTQSMGDSRRRGFSSGRTAARSALNQLGISNFSLLTGENRAAIWPAGVHGSISHCPDVCIAVVTNSPQVLGIGVDVEKRQVLDDDVKKHVLTERELHWLESRSPDEHWDCLMFSMKESLFKCLNPVSGIWIDFHQAELSIDICSTSWKAKLDPQVNSVATANSIREGRFMRNNTHVYSSALLTDP